MSLVLAVISGKWWLHHLHANFWCHLFVPQNSGSWNVSVNRFQSNKSTDRQNLQKKLRDQLEFCYVDKQSKKEDSKTRFLAGCNWANTFLGKLHQNIRRSHQAVIIEVKGLEIFNDLLLSNGIMEKGRKKEDESKILADQLWPDVEICMKSLEEAVVCLKASGVLKIS